MKVCDLHGVVKNLAQVCDLGERERTEECVSAQKCASLSKCCRNILQRMLEMRELTLALETSALRAASPVLSRAVACADSNSVALRD